MTCHYALCGGENISVSLSLNLNQKPETSWSVSIYELLHFYGFKQQKKTRSCMLVQLPVLCGLILKQNSVTFSREFPRLFTCAHACDLAGKSDVNTNSRWEHPTVVAFTYWTTMVVNSGQFITNTLKTTQLVALLANRSHHGWKPCTLHQCLDM